MSGVFEDFGKLIERARADKFFGEMVIKWNAGEPVLIEIHRTLTVKEVPGYSFSGNMSSGYFEINAVTK